MPSHDVPAHGGPIRMPQTTACERRGDADIAAIGALLADPARCRVLMALSDGRALPAGLLATEAGVAASTASSHLRKLATTGLLSMERHGRNRYYRLAGPQVGQLIEGLTQLAPTQPIRSLCQGTRAHALRQARTCYDHLAGRLGVALMRAMLDREYLIGGDGAFDPRPCRARQTDRQRPRTGVSSAIISPAPSVADCSTGSSKLDWIRRTPANRAVHISEAGHSGLHQTFNVQIGSGTTRTS